MLKSCSLFCERERGAGELVKPRQLSIMKIHRACLVDRTVSKFKKEEPK